MQTAAKDVLYDEISRHNKPTLWVNPGERFRVETELNTGDWLHSLNDDFTVEKVTHKNPSSGAIYIQGAKPGHILVVKILDIQISDMGYTGFGPGMTPFPEWIRDKYWGRMIAKTVKIEGGLIHWSDRLKLPLKPMIGLLGTAPALGAAKNTENGQFGGNMDIQEIAPGNTVFLPVFVDGALLHVGDLHALMGDGEICAAGGIETRGTVTLEVNLAPKPSEMTWPRIETPDYIVTVGCARPAEDAFKIAVQEMILWMSKGYDFEETEAFLLLGQILEARCTQFVDPLFTYICKVNKQYLNP